METACSWLLDSLSTPEQVAPRTISERNNSRNDNFDLQDIIAFFPEAKLPALASSLDTATSFALQQLRDVPVNEDDEITSSEYHEDIRAVVEILWSVVKKTGDTLSLLSPIILKLHDVFPNLPNDSTQDHLAKVCEIFWLSSNSGREKVVPGAILYLLQQSLGVEKKSNAPQERSSRAKPISFVRRLHLVRKSLDAIQCSHQSPAIIEIRSLILRSVTSATYFRAPEGRKYIAHLLSIEELQDDVFDTIFHQMTAVRKSVANLYGAIFLVAWKIQRSDFLQSKVMDIAEKAIRAGSEPLASNLKTILSMFHSNKRVNGVDLLLNEVYGPVLYRNLQVANPLVRRNAVTIMADAFPIHDPGATMEDIESGIVFQCGKLLNLLQDPSPIVRKAASEGSCRVLGLFWELVPIATARNMVDIITSKLAFDVSSAQVRLAVFEGLAFLLDNHLCHQILAIVLPRLEPLIHDKTEKVRLSFLDLLLCLKSKRIRSLRYFDIVPIDHLLRRLPLDSPPAAAKIMRLTTSSFFPLERKGKTAEEVASSQSRACLSMLKTHRQAAKFFYSHLNLYVPPGPLCEFAMRISSIALKASDRKVDGSNGSAPGAQSRRRSRRRPRSSRRADMSEEIASAPDEGNEGEDASSTRPDRSVLLSIVADVLVSASPSLQKEANAELRQYIDNIFGGEAMKPLLVERGNSLSSRASSWRIASCISPKELVPIKLIWREQIGAFPEKLRGSAEERAQQKEFFASLILCAIRWDLLSPLAAVLSGWSDGAISGNRTSSVCNKSQKKGKTNKRGSKTRQSSPQALMDSESLSSRSKFLQALCVCGNVIVGNEEVRNEFTRAVSRMFTGNECEDRTSNVLQITAAIRKGCLGALDFALDECAHPSEQSESVPRPHLLLQGMSVTCKVSVMLSGAMCREEFDLYDFRELVLWGSNAEVWKRVGLVGEGFASSLATLCLGSFADAVSLEVLKEQDIENIVTATQCILTELLSSEQKIPWRSTGEVVRIAFQLRDQLLTVDPEEQADGVRYNADTLQNCSSVLLGNLSSCVGEDDEEEIEGSLFASEVRLLNLFADKRKADFMNSQQSVTVTE